jgi:hypothetical protein
MIYICLIYLLCLHSIVMPIKVVFTKREVDLYYLSVVVQKCST